MGQIGDEEYTEEVAPQEFPTPTETPLIEEAPERVEAPVPA